jgi:hypothetical protein
VIVKSPLKASSLWIFEFMRNNISWIQGQIKAQKLKEQQQLVIAANREVPFLGEPRRIQVVISPKPRVVLREDQLFLFIQEQHRDKLEKLFSNWLLEQAREYMATQTIKVARQLGLDHKLKDVVFRKTKSKWGHCDDEGIIQYNWLVMMAPREVVNYLIVHETSHLRYLDHSRRFWNTVQSLCPDYKEHRTWLNDNGHRLWTRPPR